MAGHGEVVLLDGERVGALGLGEVGGGDGRVAAGLGQDLHPQRLVGTPFVGPVVRWVLAHQEVLALSEEQDGTVRGRAREVPHVGGSSHQRRRAAARVAALP
ncbi:hypothetical protein GCM10014715_15780 [Streptomyces spiralis]|uniref:Uncharacterized protein n=1 Tax=Streptomyces spiralis TaxID=66376 RepID=A0A919DNI7_9ACTN|nr:hypothetical protein GCM10014715_15780 [Streptomyces spiralis]